MNFSTRLFQVVMVASWKIYKYNIYLFLIIYLDLYTSNTCYGLHFFNWTTKAKETFSPLFLHQIGRKYQIPGNTTACVLKKCLKVCPAEDNVFTTFNPYCLVPNSEKHSCSKSAEPLLIKSNELDIPCGTDGKSNYYDFVYRICTFTEDGSNANAPLQITSSDSLLYRICYNTEKNETIFTYQHLSDDLTFPENLNGKKYKLNNNNYSIPEVDFTKLKSALGKHKFYFVRDLKKLYKFKPLLLTSSLHFPYLILAPSTFHYINVKPAWKNVIQMWDIINNYLRITFLKTKGFIQINGSMGELELKGKKVTLGTHTTVPKYFWKLVYIPSENNILAIILHNVPHEKYITDRLCHENDSHSCEIKNWHESSNYSLEKFAYCCDANVISNKYHLPQHLIWLQKKEYFSPLILTYRDGEYSYPQTYNGLENTENGWMEKHFLFCPAKTEIITNIDKHCLVRSTEWKPYCQKPVKFINVESTNYKIYCKYSYRNVGYRLCTEEGQSQNNDYINGKNSHIKLKDFIMYSYCYNAEKNETVFTYHRISSPNLLQNKKLKKENQLKFYSDYDIEKNNRPNYKHIGYKFVMKKFYSPTISTYGLAKLLMLVPPEDMAFPTWRKLTYISENVKFAWEKTVKLWNLITAYLQLQSRIENEEFIYVTGSHGKLKLNENYPTFKEGDITLPKYFWKVVYNLNMTKSIVIILHNVPEAKYISESDKLCKKSKCNMENWYKNPHLPKFAYCCNSEVITKKYNFPKSIQGLMRIKEYFSPLVLTLYEGKYQYPKIYDGIYQDDNSKIKFLFFCPPSTKEQEKSLQSCPLPTKKKLPYCEKPVNFLWLKSQDSEHSKCGNNENSIFIKVIYEVCSENAENEHITNEDLTVYGFCFDPSNMKTLYTVHQIKSPSLLINEDLEDERDAHFGLDQRNYLFEQNFQQKPYQFNFHAKPNTLRPLLLISPDDFAFALWKKPVYHCVNTKPAWEDVINMWNAINDHLRQLAIEKKEEFIQISGSSVEDLVLDGNVVYLDEAKKIPAPLYFWKVVYDSNKTKSIAIIVHNVPHQVYVRDMLCARNICNTQKSYQQFFYVSFLTYCCESEIITKKYNLPETKEQIYLQTIYDYTSPT